MSCKFDEILLYEYLDGILGKEEKLIVNNHLSFCSECRKKTSEIKLLFYEIENVDKVVIPEEVSEIRASVVNQAFTESESASKKVYLKAKSRYKNTKTVLRRTPVISSLIPTKEKTSKMIKGISSTGLKLYGATKKEKPTSTKNAKKLKRLGELI